MLQHLALTAGAAAVTTGEGRTLESPGTPHLAPAVQPTHRAARPTGGRPDEQRITALSEAFGLRGATCYGMDQFSPADSNWVYHLDEASAWWPAAIVMADLGATLAPSVARATEDEPVLDIGVERVGDDDADLVLLATDDLPVDPDVLRLMQSTKAAENDQILQIDATSWSSSVGVEGRMRVLDDLERLLGGRTLVTGQFPA